MRYFSQDLRAQSLDPEAAWRGMEEEEEKEGGGGGEEEENSEAIQQQTTSQYTLVSMWDLRIIIITTALRKLATLGTHAS